jgi:hypothetical protein
MLSALDPSSFSKIASKSEASWHAINGTFDAAIFSTCISRF